MTNDAKRTDRTIDLTIDIDATLEEVWQALTTGEGSARWFAPYAPWSGLAMWLEVTADWHGPRPAWP